MNIVEQYWSSAVTRLQTEVEGFNKLIGHAAEQGHENELSLSRLLANLIPKRLGIGGGMIIDNSSKRSKQTDIIIYDLADQPTLMAQSSQVIFPIEVVHAAIEVKTTLTAKEIEDCGGKKAALDLLTPANGASRPIFAVLAYDAWAQPETVAEHILNLKENERPDILCLLNPGMLSGAMNFAQKGYGAGFIPVHKRDANGSRVAGEWVKLEKIPEGAIHHEYGSAFPVTRLGRKGFYAGEPGRALLLFCGSLLQELANRKAIPIPVLNHYLTPVAREMIQLQASPSSK
ncbi:DUF6602 domain-containing protein [Streptomyces iakyrus]|uniref:DUF6602 domain-containing protein n=1 Tax=Streptomyces iakyrus TaxID=68219 RepID=UPI0036E36923